MITAPTLRLRSIEWMLDRPAQINADLSGKRTVATPLYGKWSARVELATYETEALFRNIRSFLVRAAGGVRSFRLPATVESQNGNSGVTVSATASAGARNMTLTGMATTLAAGQLVTVNDQLLQLTEDQVGGVITFEPALREQAASGTAAETASPYALVYLADETVSWSVEPPQRFSASFAVEEAF